MEYDGIGIKVEGRKGDWIHTTHGNRFFPFDPKEEEIRITEIAHSLGNICRFVGHCKHFYSVAEHSIHVSKLVPKHLACPALLHDAAEAYMGDLSRPIKQYIPVFSDIEEKIMKAVYSKFGYDLSENEKEVIREADNRVLAHEARQIMRGNTKDWNLDPMAEIYPEEVKIRFYSPDVSRVMFLKQYLKVIKR
jgi:hypothetical protein